ncbi:hypothetical protein [Oceanobacillus piezotolerans]|uniref:hypothetical protein n=1 Tax=Oceanobacillus piezotolerans TaxID=2448030 RepID=UPI001314CC87|nr:hypothetical protein [Oceanobacillus piezotolerans]
MKKVLILLFIIIMLMIIIITACTEDEVSEPVEVEQNDSPEQGTVEPTQEERNEQLKEEAIEADFEKINGNEVEEGTKLKASGEITNIFPEDLRGGDFMLSVEESENENGVYHVVDMKTEKIPIEEGQVVTAYGVYDGKDESGMPIIIATIIE